MVSSDNSQFAPKSKISVDTETTGLAPWNGDMPFGIGMSDEDGNTWYCEWEVNPVTREVMPKPDEWEFLNKYLRDESYTKIFHNARFDYRMLNTVDLKPVGRIEDTYFASRVYNNIGRDLGLKSLAEKFCGISPEDMHDLHKEVISFRRDAKNRGWNISKSPYEDYWIPRQIDPTNHYCEIYCRQDCYRTIALHYFYEHMFKKETHFRETYERELELLTVVLRMEEYGVACDKDIVIQERKESMVIKLEAERAMDEIAGYPVNPNSPTQLTKVLYETLGLPVLGRTAKGQPSTRVYDIRQHANNPFVNYLLTHRSAHKSIGTFFDNYLEKMVPDPNHPGRHQLHPGINQCGTVTGRFCIAQGTPIEIVRDLSKKPTVAIEDVQPGDWAYTFDDNLKPTLRKVLWKEKTGNLSVVRVHWQTRSHKRQGYVDMTANHQIRKTDGSWVMAKDLKRMDRVLAVARTRNIDYDNLIVTGVVGEMPDHRFVHETLSGKTADGVVHHIDHNKLNNLPENLKAMSHAKHSKTHWSEMTDESRKRHSNAQKTRFANDPSQLKRFRGARDDNYIRFSLEQLHYALKSSSGHLGDTCLTLGVTKDVLKTNLEKHEIDKIDVDSYKVNNHEILSVEILPGTVDVYDLGIEETHNFIAGEICVHNSMHAPNLQQVANANTSTLGGRMVMARRPFGPRPGYVWFPMDYAQQELRIFTDLANIKLLGERIRAGKDPNTENANLAWGGEGNPAAVYAAKLALELKDPTPTKTEVGAIWKRYGWDPEKTRKDGGMESSFATEIAKDWMKHFNYDIVAAESSIGKKVTRNRCKVVMFDIVYGGGAQSLCGLLFCSLEEAKMYLKIMHDRYPEIKVYTAKLMRELQGRGYIVNAYGRRMRTDVGREYTCVNYMVQGSAADMMKDSMVRAQKFIDNSGLNCKIVLTVHDELVFEIAKEHTYQWFIRSLQNIMEETEGRFNLPMKVEASMAIKQWDKKLAVDYVFQDNDLIYDLLPEYVAQQKILAANKNIVVEEEEAEIDPEVFEEAVAVSRHRFVTRE